MVKTKTNGIFELYVRISCPDCILLLVHFELLYTMSICLFIFYFKTFFVDVWFNLDRYTFHTFAINIKDMGYGWADEVTGSLRERSWKECTLITSQTENLFGEQVNKKKPARSSGLLPPIYSLESLAWPLARATPTSNYRGPTTHTIAGTLHQTQPCALIEIKELCQIVVLISFTLLKIQVNPKEWFSLHEITSFINLP